MGFLLEDSSAKISHSQNPTGTSTPRELERRQYKSTYTGLSKDALNINDTLSSLHLAWGAADSGKIKAEPNVTAYFLEKDLHLGNKMTLHFSKSTNAAAGPLLPRKVANSIPFSKSKLPQIINRFAVKPNSAEAQVIKQTIEECEAPGIRGEDKYCATSLESLVDIVRAGNRCRRVEQSLFDVRACQYHEVR